MSFEQGRETLDAPKSPVTPNPANERDAHENELPLPPQYEHKSEPLNAEARERLEHVLNSDIGLTTLLNRLKQSLSSARDFSTFLKERAILEEKHAQSLKRLSRSTHELVRRPESRSGTFAQAFEDSTKIHDRIADNGLQFAQSLNHMCNELQDMMNNTERSRKHWKHTGLEAENRVADAENAMNKAKGRYNNLADQYDRARTGEKSGGKFGIKGHKSAAQQEEDLHRKMEAADGEYAAKVQAAQAARTDLINTHRPQAVRALQAIIKECDGALGMQFAKYAGLTERLLLGNGLVISPLKNQTTTTRSLREVVQGVDNDKDFNDHVLSFTAKAGQRGPDIRYEKHPSMGSKQQVPQHSYDAPPQFSTPERSNTGFNAPYDQNRQQPGQVSGVMTSGDGLPGYNQNRQPGQGGVMSGGVGHSPYGNQNYAQSPVHNSPLPQLPPISLSSDPEPKPEDGTPTKSPQTHQFGPQSRPSMDSYANTPPTQDPTHSRGQSMTSELQGSRGPSLAADISGERGPSFSHSGGPALPAQQHQPPQDDRRPPSGPQNGLPSASVASPTGAAMLPSNQRRTDMNRPNLPPLRPVFGVSLDELFKRDGSAVPTIVYECVKAVDMFGLDTEGIYRTSGSAPNIMQMKTQFDHDSSQVDFRNPANFHHDIASVTTLLKHFLRDLPDPLFTSEAYTQFIQAAKIDNDDIRRDSLHAVINNLPDPNYATLRVLTLHLHRVAAHAEKNRMTPANLAICLGPTFMGQSPSSNGAAGPDIKDAGWQARVVETILNYTYEIFDDD